jgi:hypothetical protein
MKSLSLAKIYHILETANALDPNTPVIEFAHLSTQIKQGDERCDVCGKLLVQGDMIDIEPFLNHRNIIIKQNTETAFECGPDLVVPVAALQALVNAGTKCNRC